MRYGESTFDILYLVFAIGTGIWILARRPGSVGRILGAMALILGAGDAFHLVPRVLNYFYSADFTVALGIGKLITSITMTVFYLLLFMVWRKVCSSAENRHLTAAVIILTVLRILLCLFPQNGWFSNSTNLLWAVIRNIPFILLGALIVVLFYQRRDKYPPFRRIWFWVLLSFLFYIPVAVGAGLLPVLGMLMLPKTVCYIILLIIFIRSVREDTEL